MKTSLKTWMTTTPTPKPLESKITNEIPPNPNPSRQLKAMTVTSMKKTVENCVEEDRKGLKSQTESGKGCTPRFLGAPVVSTKSTVKYPKTLWLACNGVGKTEVIFESLCLGTREK